MDLLEFILREINRIAGRSCEHNIRKALDTLYDFIELEMNCQKAKQNVDKTADKASGYVPE